MNHTHFQLMQNLSEIVQYEHSDIPLYIRTANLSDSTDMCAPCHWHDDIEWIHILDGRMRYYINGTRIVLHKSDSLMVNTRQMHYGYSYEGQDCVYSCILFHPSLFCSNPALLQKYVAPILGNPGLEYLYFSSSQEPGPEVSKFLSQIIKLKEEKQTGYEMESIAVMQMLWSRLVQKKILLPGKNNQDLREDLKSQNNMVSYISRHYRERITLNKIAASGHVSRSKCCRIFKHYLQQSPVNYLNEYRLKVSCSLLKNTDKSIAEIALSCGFNHLSYFSKIFRENLGCTPSEYRNSKV